MDNEFLNEDDEELTQLLKNKLAYLIAEGFVEVFPPDEDNSEFRYRLMQYDDESIVVPRLPEFE